MAVPAIFYKDDGRVDYTPSGAVTAGDVVDLGDLVGIATDDIAANAAGSLAVEGIFNCLKKTSEVWTFGAPVYWDVGTGTFSNNVSYSEAVAGFAAAAAASGDLRGLVYLTPGVARS